MRSVGITPSPRTEMDAPVVGIGSTIDNDLIGADMTIGVETALNTALKRSIVSR